MYCIITLVKFIYSFIDSFILQDETFAWLDTFGGFSNVVGIILMLLISYKYSTYLYQLHENELWFSEIMVATTLLSVELSKYGICFAKSVSH